MYGRAFETHFIRSTQKSPPKNPRVPFLVCTVVKITDKYQCIQKKTAKNKCILATLNGAIAMSSCTKHNTHTTLLFLGCTSRTAWMWPIATDVPSHVA